MGEDYKTIVQRELKEYDKLLAERDELDLKIACKFQFIRAALNMLPDDERAAYMIDGGPREQIGLTEAIRQILKAYPKEWLSATAVRDKLALSGFDFSRYTANPLASVHSVLKRLKPQEAESATIEGVMAWRWKEQTPIPNKSKKRVIRHFRPRGHFATIGGIDGSFLVPGSGAVFAPGGGSHSAILSAARLRDAMAGNLKISEKEKKQE